MQYAGFWKRFGAFWLDFLILLPLGVLVILGQEQSRLFHLYYFLPGLLFHLWFNIYLVKRYGGTPGKLLMGIKIVKVDGGDVGYEEAILRQLVMFAFWIPLSLDPVWQAYAMTDTQYFSMNWMERATYMENHASVMAYILKIAINVWVWSEFIVMLTNEKRRAIHDFMAGTLVIHKA
jgi:uncharacterized RDD family membrane protein YckC